MNYYQNDQVVRWYLAEFGNTSNYAGFIDLLGWSQETVIEDPFLEATVRSAARTENLWGVTWWCSHDVSRSLDGSTWDAFAELVER